LAFRDLQSFLTALERTNELKRVRVEVDPELEITEIATRVVREEGPALLFEKVKGSPYPLAINIFGSARRIELALGCAPAQLGRDLVRLAQAAQPPKWLELWKSRRTLRKVLSMRVGSAWKARSQEILEDPQLDQWPILKCWPKDAGRFMTFGLVVTEHPRTGLRNVGLYRLQMLSPTSTGMHWQIQKGGGFHYAEAEKQGKPLPLAIVIGADPYLLLAAIAPLPEGMDEVAFSGFLRRKPMKMVKAKSIALRVPAEAEFILEGEVQPQERAVEGPFGDHFGHYSHAAPFPVFHARQMTRRSNPIYLAAVVGKPPQEDRYIGDAMQEIMGPLIRLIRPEVQDLWAYYETGFHNLLVVSVIQRYGKEAMKTAMGLLGEGQLSLTKCLFLVDAQVNVRDFHAVLQAIAQNFDASEDILIIPGVPLDTLDFTSYQMNMGSKMILDATRKPHTRPARKNSSAHGGMADFKSHDSRITDWRMMDEALLVVQVKHEGRKVLEALLRSKVLEGVKIIAAVSADVNLEDRVSVLWGIFTRFDCARDVFFSETHLVGPVARYSGCVAIDATFKPGYPEPLEMTEEIRERVQARWPDYGI
jgi:4-hydroxy-3-polyprenylbenzoate decarboxylase